MTFELTLSLPMEGLLARDGLEAAIRYERLGGGVLIAAGAPEALQRFGPGPAVVVTEGGVGLAVVLTLVCGDGRCYLFDPHPHGPVRAAAGRDDG